MKLHGLRRDRVLFLIVALSLVLVTGLYFVIQRGKLGDTRLATDKTLLSGLAVGLVLLTLGLAGLLVRNMARVIAERKSGVLGSRLQARVAFSFLFLVLIPSLTLFVGAITIVSRTLRDLAPPELDRTLRQASQVALLVQEEASTRAVHAAGRMARDLETGPLARAAAGGELARWLTEARRRHGMAAVGFIPRTGSPVAVADSSRGGAEAARPSELTSVPENLVYEVLQGRRPPPVGERLAYGWRAVAAAPVIAGGEVLAVAWCAVYLPEAEARRVDKVLSAAREVEALQQRRPAVQRVYVALFALLTLLVLFTAVWASFFLTRQMTGPIVELARGTEALARGELAYRVPGSGRDEIGSLVASFNRMAGEIQRQRLELEGRRRYIETLLEAIPVGVLSLDAEGNVFTANRAALEVLHLEELIPGTPILRALAGGRESVVKVVQPVLSGQTRRMNREVPIETEDGAISLEVTAERFVIPERRDGTLVVLEDLTQLRRAERLAAWGEVARRLAHEIKNPLTPIRLSAERLLRRFKKNPEAAGEVLEEGVGTIVREVDSLKTLVDEFSRYSRLPEVRPVPADIGQVAEEAVALYRSSHAEIDLTTDWAPDLPPHMIDPEAMRRAVINLLENAVALVGHGGKIRVRSYRGDGLRPVVLEVSDNGPGLPPGDRKQLFLPTFSRRPGGTGLGLAIVHRVVTDHDGRIRAEDNPGGGIRFIIELPECKGFSRNDNSVTEQGDDE